MRASLLILALLFMLPAWAERPCVGLVLGGGGARGAAHIGVLKVLERERVPICAVTGTSMGAIVGGMYASGYAPDEIEAILAAVDWADVLNDDPPRGDFPMRRKNDTLRYLLDYKLGFRDGAIQLPRGAIQGQKLLLLLRKLTLHTWETPDFDALPIPFRAVATNIVTGGEKVFSKGDLALAIRASMSVPGAFQPLKVDGELLVDGGIVNNVPVDIAKGMGAERLIVVDVGAPLAAEQDLNSPFSITMQMLDILMKQRTAAVMQALGPDDVRIHPELGDIGSADFHRAVDAIPAGMRAAEAAVEKLRELAVDDRRYLDWQARHRKGDWHPTQVAFVKVVRTRSKTASYVERELSALADKPLDLPELERAIGGAYGQGNYERITWRPLRRKGETGIQVTPVDKAWGPNFLTFGLQLSDNFEGDSAYQLGVEYTMTGLNRFGGEWRTRAEIGENTGFRSEFFQPTGKRGQFFAQPYFDYRAVDQPILEGIDVTASFRLRQSRVGLDIGWEPDLGSRWTLGILRGFGTGSRKIGASDSLARFEEDIGALRLAYLRDTLDDANFPSSGSRAEFRLTVKREVLGSSSEGEIANLIWDKALSRGRDRFLFGTRLHSTWGNPGIFDAYAPLGGFLNLSGYGERELVGLQSVLLRQVWYRRLGGEGELFSVPAYIGASLEGGAVGTDRDLLFEPEGLVYAGSAFIGLDSPFGPIFLGYGRAQTGRASAYLTFGTLLRPDP
jgi:NTE family protein